VIDRPSLKQIGRRRFLAVAAAGPTLGIARSTPPPIIDTHMHLFDTRRPGGIPWPEKKDTLLYRPALPDRFRKIAVPLGIRGYIEVEASPRLEDNEWVLKTGADDPYFLGTVGNLHAGRPAFEKNLERFHRNPLFLGIRFGNIWGWDLSKEISNPTFLSHMRMLAETGLALDTADPDPALIAAVVQLTNRVPNLRVVIDHLPQLEEPAESKALAMYEADMRELGRRPQIYVKISEVPRRVGGKVPNNLNFYRPRLDQLWSIFGEDRLMYGSDWPNSDLWGPYRFALELVQQYVSEKGPAAVEKVFWKNSIAAYRWKRRDSGRPRWSDPATS